MILSISTVRSNAVFLIRIYITFGYYSNVLSSDYQENLMQSWKNTPFYGFRGIRYAEPPINDLRFKAPRPFSGSSFENLNLTELTTDGPECPSPYSKEINEDCLFLNVYTKNLTASVAVIIFIHPGGFYIGSGRSDEFGPEFLMEKDIVLVTFNYRLGFFGFLSTGDNRAPGNAGLKDQNLVLKWVQENIQHFGGNRKNVTLLGASAGSMSASLHLASDMSEGLFNQMITISGGILPQLKLPTHQNELIERQINILNCQENWFDCLKNTNATIIAKSVYSMFEFGRDNPIFLWQPVIENDFGEPRFLKDQPFKLLNERKLEKIKLLSGFVKDELADSAFQIVSNYSLLRKWRNDFEEIGPICLQYERGSERSRNISVAVWEKFFETGLSFQEITSVFSEALIIYPIYKLANFMVKYSKVFLYKFTYKGAFSNFSNTHNTYSENFLDDNFDEKISNIVEHLDDLNYIFTSKKRNNSNLKNSDKVTVERLTELISSFAIEGYPTIDNIEIQPFSDDESYLEISNALYQRQYPFNRSKFWSSVFE